LHLLLLSFGARFKIGKGVFPWVCDIAEERAMGKKRKVGTVVFVCGVL